MTRNYVKMKHLEPLVFAKKQAGYTNAEIAAELGLNTAQIKGLIKRHNRRERAGETPAPHANQSSAQADLNVTLERMVSEVNELQEAIREIERRWEQLSLARRTGEEG